jgi:murein DD-endopeptidase MepM/ murein hydrolase activator NlpD
MRRAGKEEAGKKNARLAGLVMAGIAILVAGQALAASIRISWNPEKVTPGAVVPIRVESPVELLAADASTGKDLFPLVRRGEREYLALVGIDMDLKEPTVSVGFTFYPARGGPPYRIRADLKVLKDKAVPRVQNLSLPTGMVDFSRESLLQIRQDSRTLGEIFAARTRERYRSGGFLMPVEGRISTRFGVRRVLNGKPRSLHSGVDIAVGKGTPIKASNGGRIVLADGLYLSGNTVVVDHGWGVSTNYAHLDRIDVTEGQMVEKGQVIGTVGSTGRSTGPHLHFGALIRGVKVDPLLLIEATEDF